MRLVMLDLNGIIEPVYFLLTSIAFIILSAIHYTKVGKTIETIYLTILSVLFLICYFVIILLTSFKGITHEHDLGDAFKEALPFTALLVVFFGVVSVIADQQLFTPIITYVLAQDVNSQAPIFFVANGVLSAISDNVFVATIYINEIKDALDTNVISRSQFDKLAIAINTGTNIPSIATPNGQAAFLFLLTSSLAPLINLSYMRMVIMALPYTIVLSIVGFIAVVTFL